MKQYITEDQLIEISADQYHELLMLLGVDIFVHIDEKSHYHELVTIDRMIEIFTNRGYKLTSYPSCNEGFNYVTVYKDCGTQISYDKKELVDALWEAIKGLLEMIVYVNFNRTALEVEYETVHNR